eukprot:CAMPEP_0119123636 /NCGR_PEP_ID=MMETSP1310-20130426/3521_1 /TAXON_ID=464262 /ORGANISM="Genus nov. species nov., Strain RCC2339" /LENGTH=49 /DNA_ID=CAMNT_0007113483 /DNA_START=253 /DNA_END=402 /DNA_ORIENTATION=-
MKYTLKFAYDEEREKIMVEDIIFGGDYSNFGMANQIVMDMDDYLDDDEW